jgi:hypothetical protein
MQGFFVVNVMPNIGMPSVYVAAKGAGAFPYLVHTSQTTVDSAILSVVEANILPAIEDAIPGLVVGYWSEDISPEIFRRAFSTISYGFGDGDVGFETSQDTAFGNANGDALHAPHGDRSVTDDSSAVWTCFLAKLDRSRGFIVSIGREPLHKTIVAGDMATGREGKRFEHEIETNLADDGLLDLGEEILMLFDELRINDIIIYLSQEITIRRDSLLFGRPVVLKDAQ